MQLSMESPQCSFVLQARPRFYVTYAMNVIIYGITQMFPRTAGKTTLLDILAGRRAQSGHAGSGGSNGGGSGVTGEVRVDGCLVGPGALRRLSGSVRALATACAQIFFSVCVCV